MTSSTELFRRYPNDIFIETGAYEGDGIAAALEAGFPQVISIERDAKAVAHCRNRFAGDHRVEVIHGDSAQYLAVALQRVAGVATIWLDAHIYDPKAPRFNNNCPLRAELLAIARANGRRHTILVDDLRACETATFGGLRLDEIIHAILGINPNYHLRLDKGLMEHDVLAAWPPG